VAIDLAAAACDAIATYFGEAVTGLTARRGWPEANIELDLEAGPVLTVEPGPVERTLVPPRRIDQSGTSTLVVTYRVAWITITAQLDLWAQHRAARDDTAALIEAALHNRLPAVAGLYLDSTGYHGRPLTITCTDSRPEDQGDGAARGEWRQTWEIRIDTDLVVLTEHPKLTEADIAAAIDAGGDVVTDTVTVGG